MAYEQREGQGSLFKNDKKETDKHPNARGSALIGGVEYWVDAWTKQGAKGPWQSLSFKRKDAPKSSKPKPKAEPAEKFEDDDLPFN